jgi:hypothetical protein
MFEEREEEAGALEGGDTGSNITSEVEEQQPFSDVSEATLPFQSQEEQEQQQVQASLACVENPDTEGSQGPANLGSWLAEVDEGGAYHGAPREVVRMNVSQAVAVANNAVLEGLQQQWQQQVLAVAEANAEVVAATAAAAAAAEAALAEREQLQQEWLQLKEGMEAAALATYEAAVDAAQAENKKLAQLHQEEVQLKAAREKEHEQVGAGITSDNLSHYFPKDSSCCCTGLFRPLKKVQLHLFQIASITHRALLASPHPDRPGMTPVSADSLSVSQSFSVSLLDHMLPLFWVLCSSIFGGVLYTCKRHLVLSPCLSLCCCFQALEHHATSVLLQQQLHNTAVAAARREHAAAVAGARARLQVRAARARQVWEQEVEEEQRKHEKRVQEVRAESGPYAECLSGALRCVRSFLPSSMGVHPVSG